MHKLSKSVFMKLRNPVLMKRVISVIKKLDTKKIVNKVGVGKSPRMKKYVMAQMKKVQKWPQNKLKRYMMDSLKFSQKYAPRLVGIKNPKNIPANVKRAAANLRKKYGLPPPPNKMYR